MNEKEYVIAVIEGTASEYVPWQLDLTVPVADILTEHYGDKEFLYHNVNNHLVRAKYRRKNYFEPCKYSDLFHVTWNTDPLTGDIGNVSEYLLGDAAAKLYEFPAPDLELAKSLCEDLVFSHDGRFKIFEIGFALFERAWSLRSMEQLLMDFIIDKDFVQDLFEKICDYQMQILDVVTKYPIDCVMIGDDWGQQAGLIMGLPLWREHIRPYIKKLLEKIRNAGLYACLHSCGDISELFDNLIDMGLNIYNTFQPEIYDFADCKKKYGNNLTFYGGISTQGVLAHGNQDDVRNDIKEKKKLLHAGGGYILAPTHQITLDVPLDNILAFVEEAQRK